MLLTFLLNQNYIYIMIQNKNYLDFNFFQFSDSCETKKRAIENNIETENNHLNKRICNIVKTQIVPQVHADGLDLSLDAELNRELFNLSDEESDEAIYKEEDELEGRDDLNILSLRL